MIIYIDKTEHFAYNTLHVIQKGLKGGKLQFIILIGQILQEMIISIIQQYVILQEIAIAQQQEA